MAQRSLLVRALWFVLVGWWLTPVVVNVAWLLNATVVGIPLGVKLVNLVPTVLTLREPRSVVDPESPGRGQRSLLVRAAYFVFVGWWLSWLWANVAAFAAVTVVGLPVAVWMFNRLPFVTSLYRFDG
ncbi:MAG: YccF domain-containing protein [Halobacteriaceae archaeon]